MSDSASPIDGAKPRARKAVRKVKNETRSLATAADHAREELIVAAIRRARARREFARRWARNQAEVAGVAVQSRPVTAIGFALGLGVIIGLLAAR